MAETRKQTRVKQSPTLLFTLTEKRRIIKAFQDGNKSKQQIWHEFTGHEKEKGQIVRWMRQLGYLDGNKVVKPPSLYMMKNHKVAQVQEMTTRESTTLRIQLLEQELKDSILREQSYVMMIEIAERELKINIRKKLSTK